MGTHCHAADTTIQVRSDRTLRSAKHFLPRDAVLTRKFKNVLC
jgi:hypothetical protein